MSRTVVGIDFGTLSGRAVVVSVADGKILASAEHTYPHGVIDRELAGQPLPPDWALQVPADYVEVLGKVVPEALETSGIEAADVVGVAVDFTSCTVFPTDEAYQPLCERPEFEKHPHAYVKLWKHHASQRQGKVVNKVLAELAPETPATAARSRRTGSWQKPLHCSRKTGRSGTRPVTSSRRETG